MAIPFAGGSKGGKKKGKKRPPHDPPGTGGHPHPLGGGGGGGSPPHDPPGTGGHSHPVTTNNNAWVRNRQRRLRNAGYNVVVDGVWGARAQAAWQAYLRTVRERRQRRALRSRVRSISVGVRQEQTARVRALAARARADATRRAMQQQSLKMAGHVESIRSGPVSAGFREDRKKYRKHVAALTGAEANRDRRSDDQALQHLLRTQRDNRARGMMRLSTLAALEERTRRRGVEGPRDVLGRLSIRNLSQTLFDPEVGNFNPLNRAHVEVVQRWLRQHGHGLEVDGVWGPATFQALLQSYEEEAARERREQVEAIRDRFYKSGIIKPGDPIPFVGNAPTPGELLSILQDGGFTAAMLLRYLEGEGQRLGPLYTDTNYLRWSRRFLDQQIGAKYGPFAQGPRWLTGPMTDLRRAMLLGDFSAPFLGSTSFGELERQVIEWQRRERDRIEALQREAAEGQAWWARGLEYLAMPAKVVKTGIVAEWNLRGWTALQPHNLLRDSLGLAVAATLDSNIPSFEGLDYTEALDESRATWSEFEQEHPWLNLAAEIILDPLNLVGAGLLKNAALAPLRVAAATALRAERLGLALDDAGRIRSLSAALRAPATSGRWADREIHALADELATRFDDLTLNNPALNRAMVSFDRARRVKTVSLDLARARARQAARLGFRTVEGAALSPGVRRLVNGVTAQTRAELDRLDQSLTAIAHKPAPRLLNHLAKQRISIYSDVERGEFTSVGWQLRSRIASELEQVAVQRVARDEARQVVALKRADDEKYLMLRRQGRVREANDYLRQIEDDSYRQFVREYGTWFVGGGDPRLTALVRSRLQGLITELDTALMPAWQDFLQRTAGAEGLFNAEGKWVGAGGITESVMRQLSRHSLDFNRRVIISNPNHGKFFDRQTMESLVNDEVARRANSIRAYSKVEEAAGRPRPEGWVDEQIEEVEKDVRHWWKHVPGKGWTDTRPTLAVPGIYLRQYARALWGDEMIDTDFKTLLARLSAGDDRIAEFGRAVTGGPDAFPQPTGRIEDKVDTIPSVTEDGTFYEEAVITPAQHVEQRMDEELFRVGQWLSGGEDDFNEELLRLDSAPIARALDSSDALNQEMLDFRSVIRDRTRVARVGYNEVLSQALRDEGAIWQALRNTERRWARAIYLPLAGSLAAWRFAVLPLRPAWVVRNVADNFVKTMLAGVVDPRAFFTKQGVRREVQSIFDVGYVPLHRSVKWLDGVFGTNAAASIEAAGTAFWRMGEDVLQKVFGSFDVYIPREVLSDARGMRRVEDPNLKLGPAGKVSETTDRIRDSLWELAGNRPESFFRRTLYRGVFVRERDKLLARGLDVAEAETQASRTALKAVNDSLFDYSKITTLEDNLRVFLPFIYFWRKNTPYWSKQFLTKPWFLADVGRFEEALGTTNEDLPEWMQRYVSLAPAADVVAKVPGLEWMAPILQDAKYDPLNFLSFAPLYRAFKDENALLPGDRAGLPFISAFVDGMNQMGLGLNPLFGKPLEVAGVLNYRAWQSIFPQTQLAQVVTQKFWNDRFPNGLNIEAMLTDPILQALGQQTTSEIQADRFNEFVQMEMAGQVARGEPASREKAEEKIRDWLLVQTLVGYFVGAYARRITPEDVHLYQIAEMLHEDYTQFENLSPEEQKAYQMFKRRGWDELAYDRYLETLPLVQAFYRLESHEAREEFKREFPQIIPHVEPVFRGTPPSVGFIQTSALAAQTDAAMDFYKLVDTLELDRETTKAAESLLVTDELRAWWAKNDTPAQQRAKHLRGLYHRHLKHLSDSFFALGDDFEAKEGFLAAHPELARWWQDNNDAADDFKMVINQANADLRERYFEFVDAGDWGTADSFLKQFPFIFEFTSAANRVTADGEWLPKSGATRSQHAQDYLAAKPYLDLFFSMPEGDREAWLNGDSDGARIVRAYFDKYASGGGGSGRGGTSQHARDFLAVRHLLDRYFSLEGDARRRFLRTPDGQRVLAYFKKYGKMAQAERQFAALANDDPVFRSRNSELRQRLWFWNRYFALTPDQRPLFVMRQAEKHGIFIYGALGAQEQYAREQEFLRHAFAAGIDARTAHFLRIRPLLDFFFTLGKEQKALFLRANPDLQQYLDRYSRSSASGDPKLDKLIERYFKLPPDSNERSHFLRKHPEVQRYFDEKSTPEERALRNLLNVYFEIDDPEERKQFLARHPEIPAYFDKRKRERDEEQFQYGAFDDADPRLLPFRLAARSELEPRAEAMRRLAGLRRIRGQGDLTLLARRERRPLG